MLQIQSLPRPRCPALSEVPDTLGKVKQITEQLCGSEISSMQVSRATAQLDPILEQWRHRPLGHTPYLVLDARYEKVRQDGQVQDAAVLIATGVEATGQRRVLGLSVALGEHEVHWRAFCSSWSSVA
jgi:putative transposase